MLFVTESPVTFFLITPIMGDFYLFFMRSDVFFVTVLCWLVRMALLVR
jgi:hypothetical protein